MDEKQQPQNVPKPSDVSTPVATDAYKDEGWSWGAFAFNWAFAIAIRKYMYLFLILLMFVPILNIVAFFGVMIFFGVKGREMAKGSVTFSSDEQRLGFMKGMDHAGKIVFFIWVVMFAIGIVASIILASLGNQMMNTETLRDLQQQSAVEMESQLSEEEMQEMLEMQEEMMKFFQEE